MNSQPFDLLAYFSNMAFKSGCKFTLKLFK
jgi:hypothetical protein